MRIKLLSIGLLSVLVAVTWSCKKINPQANQPKNVKIWNRGDTASEVRNGVLLKLYFDELNSNFSGLVINMNNRTVTNARVETHTFDPNGTPMFEYGPSTPTDVLAGDTLLIVLPAKNAGNFKTFTMHAEIGTSAGSGS